MQDAKQHTRMPWRTGPKSIRMLPAVFEAITAHARLAAPQECCGLLIGDGDFVSEAVATGNAAADPLRRYEIPAADYMAQIRRCRDLTARQGRACDVVGAYHSHPHSAPRPSPTDTEQAFPEFVFVIAGPVSESSPMDIRGYRLVGKRLDEVQLSEVAP